MKAVVLEIRNGLAAVLCEDGTVKKVRRSGLVGETIELDDSGHRVTNLPRSITRWAAGAAAAVVILSGAMYGYNNAYAYSYVTMDVNPSLVFVLNRNNRVLRVEAQNDDAQAIADSLNSAGVRRMTLSEAINEATNLLYESDYLGGDDTDLIRIEISSRGKSQREALTEEVDTFFEKRDDDDLVVFVSTKDNNEPSDEWHVINRPDDLPDPTQNKTPAEPPSDRPAEPDGLSDDRGTMPEDMPDADTSAGRRDGSFPGIPAEYEYDAPVPSPAAQGDAVPADADVSNTETTPAVSPAPQDEPVPAGSTSAPEAVPSSSPTEPDGSASTPPATPAGQNDSTAPDGTPPATPAADNRSEDSGAPSGDPGRSAPGSGSAQTRPSQDPVALRTGSAPADSVTNTDEQPATGMEVLS